MTDANFDWRSFLVRWSDEWADSCDADGSLDEQDEESLRTRWLGFAPADGARITALEERLAHRLPPSYRAFLEVSDGWRHTGGFVYQLAGTEGARWYEDEAGFAEMYQEDLDEDSLPEEVLLAGMWSRALQLDVESDITYVLMDPQDVSEDGEWAVYYYRGWAGEMPDRYGSFQEFMVAMYRSFHSLRAHDRAGSGTFVNATTLALDAAVEEARCDALRGNYERAAAALTEAEAFGRPRAKVLHDQIRRMLGLTYLVSFGALTSGPLYTEEVLPVLAAEHVHSRRDDASWPPRMRPAPEDVRLTADTVLRQVRENGYRYTAPGPFGAAVDRAREQARWGDTDAAWRTLLAALPEWRPRDSDHIAPLGLHADAVLGPLLTPDRGREVLATARGDASTGTPVPAIDMDPEGLAWLAEPSRNGACAAYRFVLVEGAAADELPQRIGAEESPSLREPMTAWEARAQLRERRESSSFDDKALVAVGRAGSAWSFAFDGQPSHFDEQRFVSPAAPASADARAVVVWSAPAMPGFSEAHFHLSVAENGEEQYAFTVQGDTIRRTGKIPPSLDPERFFTPSAQDGAAAARRPRGAEPDLPTERLGERRALEAIADEFGVALPQFALTRGRLHTFTTRSWTRPPGPGESYLVLRIG